VGFGAGHAYVSTMGSFMRVEKCSFIGKILSLGGGRSRDTSACPYRGLLLPASSQGVVDLDYGETFVQAGLG
jgi:hypothetical protein